MSTIKALRQNYSRVIALNDGDILLADLLKRDRTYLETHPEQTISLWKTFCLRYRIWQRKRGLSTAVIVGHKEFFGLDFMVSKHTLVPRPETELLVTEALKVIADNSVLIDVGTGSGCIAISILKHHPVPTYVTDRSVNALAYALGNATKHQVYLSAFEGNLLAPLPEDLFKKPLIITANLPYLTKEQFENEPSIQREPYSALVAEKNGLALYEELLIQLRAKNVSTPATLFFEIDPTQTPAIKKCILAIFPNANIEIKNDLAGQDRLVIIKLNS